MTSLFDKLNLRPNERRLVIIVAIVVFILLNAFFVWPEFGEWGRLQKREREATALLKAYQTEVDNTQRYQKQLAELQQAGAAVATEEQASKLATTVNNQAVLSNVQVIRSDFGGRQPTLGRTNQFFEEQRGTISVTMEERALVDFLYNLGVGGSLIRVRSMSLNTDGPRQRLLGTVQLVASFAKRAPVRAAPAAATLARTNAAPTATANPRSTNSGLRPNLAATQTTNVVRTTNAAPSLIQRLKNWGTSAASRSNAPTKK
ncbi:MAG TPA: hypothetical protein VNT99_00295 [Methylomirabilota bacterium]|nr:hypothetical protein [Methylomirabilota bacterium]